MAGGDQSNDNDHRTVLIHRVPTYNLSFMNPLSDHFRLLDPHDSLENEPVESFLSRHAHQIQALLCVGLTPLPAEIIRFLPCLKLVVASGAGIDHIDVHECRQRGIAITNAGSAFSDDVADCAVGLLIDVLRRVSAGDRYVRAGLWPKCGDYPLGSKLGGKRIGIIGFGSIGSEIAKRLEAFNCKISYNSRKKKSSVPFPFYTNIQDLASNSDVLIACCSLTNETRHIINKDVMQALGNKGIIINIGRGALVDEKELVQFLVRGDIGGAGLDVFEQEPHVPKELFELDNVVMSPHAAVLTPGSFGNVYNVILANLNAFFANKPLVSPV